MEHIGEIVRARAWDDLVGQHTLKQRLAVSVDAAVRDHRPIDHMLLAARPGCGKTTLARLIADRGDSPFYSVTRKITEADFIAMMRDIHFGVLLIDEIHATGKAFQELLLTGLEDGCLHTMYGREIDVRGITFIGATTEPNNVIAPLRERFIYRPHFEAYTDADMAQILLGMSRRAGVPMSAELAAELAPATGGVPRFAERFVAAARDLGGEVKAGDVFAQTGVDEDGLDDEHYTYLRMLDAQNGVAGLSTIVNLLRIPGKAVEDLERLLLLRGMVRLEKKGRTLTRQGVAKVDARRAA